MYVAICLFVVQHHFICLFVPVARFAFLSLHNHRPRLASPTAFFPPIMVTFICDLCQATLKKNKVDQHCQRCRAASVSCVDCGVAFFGDDFQQHTSCISEAQKVMGHLYRGPKEKTAKTAAVVPSAKAVAAAAKVVEEKSGKKRKVEEDAKPDNGESSKKKADSGLAGVVSAQLAKSSSLKKLYKAVVKKEVASAEQLWDHLLTLPVRVLMATDGKEEE